eukprot:TRINITY_DN3636_c1_g1_i1.p1 TRINITY_DN3636_c1_g1~~TRINITY_DN3636_c1_g1_i1.p1  ORF type:complete len:533 (+),score=108.70 TRINITY_DN3636_c1_g1_i1:62-1660(+)
MTLINGVEEDGSDFHPRKRLSEQMGMDEATGLLFRQQNGDALPPYYFPRRYIILALLFMATMVCYWLRSNLSVAVLSMAKEFGWGSEQNGIVLAAFFAGYLFLQIPGSWLGTKYGGKYILALGLGFTSVFTMMMSLCASHFFLFVLCRFFTGLSEAVVYPIISCLVARWAPVSERTVFLTFIYSGGYLGTIIAMATTSPFIEKMGWKLLFVLNGVIGLVWTVLWLIFAASSPDSMRGIHPCEVEFIKRQPLTTKGSDPDDVMIASSSSVLSDNATDDVSPSSPSSSHHDTTESTKLSTPLPPSSSPSSSPSLNQRVPDHSPQEHKQDQSFYMVIRLLKNIHVWAIIAANFSNAWGFYILLTWTPTFMQNKLHFDSNSAGYLSILPYVGSFTITSIGGVLADYLTVRHVNLTLIRVGFGVTGQVVPAILLVLLSFSKEVVPSITYMTLALAVNGLVNSSYPANCIDIAPHHAGMVLGISNTFGTIPGIVAVYLTGWMLQTYHNNWALVFCLAAIIYVCSAIFVAIFTTTRRLF